MNIIVKAANKMTDLKNSTKLFLSNLRVSISRTIIKYFHWCLNNQGPSILILVLAASIITGNIWTYAFWGSVLYWFILKHRKMQYKIEKDKLDMIDLKNIGSGEDINSILASFVAQCFERDVLFFRGLKDKEYINSKDEQSLLDGLLDSVVRNMSPSLRTKIDIYYGEGRTDIIISRICYQTVTMFVATNNKAIYSGTNNLPNMN